MNNNDNGSRITKKDQQENVIVLLIGLFGVITIITTMFLHYFGRIGGSEFLCFSLFGFAALIFGLVMKRGKK